jgi:hypothetical protein
VSDSQAPPVGFELSWPGGARVTFYGEHLELGERLISYRDVAGVAFRSPRGYWGATLFRSVGLEIELTLLNGHRLVFSSVDQVPLWVSDGDAHDRLESMMDVVLTRIQPYLIANALHGIADGRPLCVGSHLKVDAEGVHRSRVLWNRSGRLPWLELAGLDLVGGRWEIYSRFGGRVRPFASCGMDEMNATMLSVLLPVLQQTGGRVEGVRILQPGSEDRML